MRLLPLLPAALFAAFASLLPAVWSGGAVSSQLAWIPSLGIELAWRADGLSLLLALLITGIGTLIFLYSSRYMEGHRNRARFSATLAAFMGAMLGAVLADDIVTLLVFWELTSITSFLLIGHEPEDARTRRSAQQSLLITVAGGLALLTAAILLGTVAGSFRIGDIVDRGPALASHPLAPLIIVLLAAGAFAKSAQVPLHIWLPNAMVAPTPVSAFLHSATMVKLGVYLLARFDPVFGTHPLWNGLLTIVGLITMIVAAVLALRESDLKRVLAYSTVVSLGTLTTLIGMPGTAASTAMVVFLVAHALYKACLFMVAGSIDHATGTRDATRLGGLAGAMPLTAATAVAASISMAGLPPTFGFVGKELLYDAGLESMSGWLPLVVLVVANASLVIVAAIVAARCFFGTSQPTPHAPHDPPFAMWFGPLLLAAAGIVFGLVPALVAPLLRSAASATAGLPLDLDLSLWHGLTPTLALSAVTLGAGVFLYSRWIPLRSQLAGRTWIDRWGADAAYDRLLSRFVQLAQWQTRRIQTGSLHAYLGLTFGAVALAVLSVLVVRQGFVWPVIDTSTFGPELVLPLLLVAAAIAVVRARSFLAGIVSAGMVGFLVALVFLFRGAPDLAFTQFSVEALAVVILLAIVGRMPFHGEDGRRRSARRRDVVVALAVGTAATLVLLSIVATPFNEHLSDFFRAASVPQAHGRNLVNVIIVDFRALDTLGEITVLTLAAMAAAAVTASAPKAPARVARTRQGHSLIFLTCSRILLPVALAVSVFVLWRGHNEPGGGFVGGLMAAAGLATYALPRGRAALVASLRVPPLAIAGAGVLVAMLSGVPGLLLDMPYLSHQWPEWMPLPIGTPLLFDIGVYLAVTGSVLTFLLLYLDE